MLRGFFRARQEKNISTKALDELAPAALNSRAAARYVGIGLRKFQSEIAAGNLVGLRAGRLRLFTRQELDAGLANLPKATATDVKVPSPTRASL
jgi:excisionase family DNA binding protein